METGTTEKEPPPLGCCNCSTCPPASGISLITRLPSSVALQLPSVIPPSAVGHPLHSCRFSFPPPRDTAPPPSVSLRVRPPAWSPGVPWFATPPPPHLTPHPPFRIAGGVELAKPSPHNPRCVRIGRGVASTPKRFRFPLHRPRARRPRCTTGGPCLDAARSGCLADLQVQLHRALKLQAGLRKKAQVRRQIGLQKKLRKRNEYCPPSCPVFGAVVTAVCE